MVRRTRSIRKLCLLLILPREAVSLEALRSGGERMSDAPLSKRRSTRLDSITYLSIICRRPLLCGGDVGRNNLAHRLVVEHLLGVLACRIRPPGEPHPCQHEPARQSTQDGALRLLLAAHYASHLRGLVRVSRVRRCDSLAIGGVRRPARVSLLSCRTIALWVHPRSVRDSINAVRLSIGSLLGIALGEPHLDVGVGLTRLWHILALGIVGGAPALRRRVCRTRRIALAPLRPLASVG